RGAERPGRVGDPETGRRITGRHAHAVRGEWGSGVSREPDPVIGIVLKAYPRLSETFIVREILMLEGLGLKLHIFAMRRPQESTVHDDVRRVRAGVTYVPDRFLSALGSIVLSNLGLLLASGSTYLAAFRYAIRRSMKERSVSTLKRFFQ